MDRNSRKKENVASEAKVPTKEYTIQIGDTFWKIAEKELGSGHLILERKEKVKYGGGS